MSDTIKRNILKELDSILDKKIRLIKQAILSAKESRDDETKSSVGDKYETGRTLMQLEVEKNKGLLSKTEKLKSDLSRIDIQKQYKKVEFGSLVYTNSGNYFVSIGIGKIKFEGKNYFCISLASPIGKVLFNKKAGDHFSFNGTEISIKNIV
jgi:transcription elongation GreA/GreB family factor